MLFFLLDKASEIKCNTTMAQLAAVVLLLSHICSCFLLFPREEILRLNAIFLLQKCSLLMPSRGYFGLKLVWHYNFHHTTTNQPLHPDPKKHIRKKPPPRMHSAQATMSDAPVPHAFSCLDNQGQDEDFSALEESIGKDIHPPPSRPPTCNGSPLKLGVTKTQRNDKRKFASAAKALATAEKVQALDAKKLASNKLKEKKRQLLASQKAERDAAKAGMKASPSAASAPGSALSESPGICSFFPKKSKLAIVQSTPTGKVAPVYAMLSPQRKRDSPKKRAQLNQAPATTPPWGYVASLPPPDNQGNLSSSGSDSWCSSDSNTEEDPDLDGSKEDNSMDWMVSTGALVHPPHQVPKKASGKSIQDPCFQFPHPVELPTKVAPGLKPSAGTIEQLHEDVQYGIWPGTHHLSILEDFIQLHFDGDNNEYWGFGLWASDLYYNDPTVIPTVHMKTSSGGWSSKMSTKKVTGDEVMVDSTAVSSQAQAILNQASASIPGSVVDMSQMDTTSDDGASGPHRNLFGGTVFDDPSFKARKPTPEERAKDLQWEGEQRTNDLKAAANAAWIRAKTLNRLACMRSTHCTGGRPPANQRARRGRVIKSMSLFTFSPDHPVRWSVVATC
jgi:hypothetical protein